MLARQTFRGKSAEQRQVIHSLAFERARSHPDRPILEELLKRLSAEDPQVRLERQPHAASNCV
jgi:hypothetical protein